MAELKKQVFRCPYPFEGLICAVVADEGCYSCHYEDRMATIVHANTQYFMNPLKGN